MTTTERKEGRFGRRLSRRGLSVVVSAVVLAVTVVGTAAVGYVVLSAVATTHTESSSTISCSPPTLPQCKDAQNATQVAYGANAPGGHVPA